MFLATLFSGLVLTAVHGFQTNSSDQRIVGGAESVISKWPFLVYVIAAGRSACGGVIIDSTHVLTAAHCFNGLSFATNDCSTAIMFGRSDRTSQADGSLGTCTTPATSKYLRCVVRVESHPDFKVFEKHDIAVLTLAQPLPTDQDTWAPIEIATEDPPAGEIAATAGWGDTHGVDGEASQIPVRFHEVDMTVWSDTQIISYFGRRYEGHVVVRDTDKAACSGDSGGPLVYAGQLVGLVSWGMTTCSDGPSMYWSPRSSLTFIKAAQQSSCENAGASGTAPVSGPPVAPVSEEPTQVVEISACCNNCDSACSCQVVIGRMQGVASDGVSNGLDNAVCSSTCSSTCSAGASARDRVAWVVEELRYGTRSHARGQEWESLPAAERVRRAVAMQASGSSFKVRAEVPSASGLIQACNGAGFSSCAVSSFAGPSAASPPNPPVSVPSSPSGASDGGGDDGSDGALIGVIVAVIAIPIAILAVCCSCIIFGVLMCRAGRSKAAPAPRLASPAGAPRRGPSSAIAAAAAANAGRRSSVGRPSRPLSPSNGFSSDYPGGSGGRAYHVVDVGGSPGYLPSGNNQRLPRISSDGFLGLGLSGGPPRLTSPSVAPPPGMLSSQIGSSPFYT